MYRYTLIANVGLCLALKLTAYGPLEQESPKAATSSSARDLDCEHTSQSDWYTVRTSFYTPTKTLYVVNWEFCNGDPTEQQVRITNANRQKVFFQFKDDEVLRVETLDLVGNHVPQLLVLTMSAGTGDDIGWHIISESKGTLKEWKPPDYDGPAEKLLRTDEDFCCKDWNFHLQGNEIVLARGIYEKGEGNCCPSRGGVVARLQPTGIGLKLVSVVRVSKPEYYRWREMFCLNCRLY